MSDNDTDDEEEFSEFSEFDDELMDLEESERPPRISPTHANGGHDEETGGRNGNGGRQEPGRRLGSSSFSDRFRRTSSAPAPARSASIGNSATGQSKLWSARRASSNVDQTLNLMDASSYHMEKVGEKSMVDIFMESQHLGDSSHHINYTHSSQRGQRDHHTDKSDWRKCRLLFVVLSSVVMLTAILLLTMPHRFGVVSSTSNTNVTPAPTAAPTEQVLIEEEAELPPEQEEVNDEEVLIEEEAELPPEQQQEVAPTQETETETEGESAPTEEAGTEGGELDLSNVPHASRLKALEYYVVDQDITEQAQLDIMGSPAKKALHWVTQRDPAQLEIPGLDEVATNNLEAELALLQRYALAVFYFSMEKDSSASSLKREGSEGRQLQTRSEQELANHQAFKGSWMSDLPICQWHGVHCAADAESVVGIRLSKHMLQGTIPRELLVGAAMPHLLSLNLGHNYLEGELPIVTQEREDAGNNLGLAIPTSPLEVLELGANQLGGKLDVILGFPQLKRLGLAYNSFTGKLPEEITDMGFLEQINLEGNQLTGSLPRVEELTALQELQLAGNGCSGPLPTGLNSLTNLQVLVLTGNKFTGQIPNEVGEASNLRELHLDGNQIDGTVPTHLGKLTKLENVRLDGNRLTGAMPQEVCKLRDAKLHSLVSQCEGMTCYCCTDCF